MNNNAQVGNFPTSKHRSVREFVIKGEGSLRLWEGIATGFSLLNSFIILTALTIYQFGLYQLVLSLVAIVGSFNIKSFDGIVAVEMRHHFNNNNTAAAKRIFKEYFLLKIFLALVLSLGVFFGSDLIAARYGADIGLFLKLVSGLLVIEALLAGERVFFESIYSFAYFAIPAIRELAKSVLLVLFIFFGSLGIADVIGVHLVGWAVALVITSFFFVGAYRRVLSGSGSYKAFLLGNLVKLYGKWVFVRYAFAKLTKNTTPWFIKFFVGTEAVALYSLAVNLVSLLEEIFPVNMLPWVFLMKLDNKKEMANIFNRSVKYIILFGAALAVLGFFFVPLILELILPKYVSALPLFKVMLLALPIFGVYKLLKGVLTILREYKILALRIVTEAVVMIGSLILLLPAVGVIGASIAYGAIYVARVFFFYPAMVRSHPYLRLEPAVVFSVDRYDREFVSKLWGQFLAVIRRYAKVKIWQ